MAPTSDSSKALHQNRPRPTVPKNIVPAIPLPYIQKCKQQQAARERAREEAVQAVQVSAGASSSPITSPIEAISAIANGSTHDHAPEAPKEAGEPAVLTDLRAATPDDEVHKVTNEEPKPEAHEERLATEYSHQSSTSAPSEGPSSGSRSNFQMPPPFVPQNQQQANTSDSVNVPLQYQFNGQRPMHHAHPSAGSIVFGGFPESNNSSPAPPLSARNAPPYPFPQPTQVTLHGPHPSNGSHIHHLSNGYSPMGPPPGYYNRQDNGTNPGIATDSYARRQLVSFGPTDGYSPSSTPLGLESHRIAAHDPTNTHSFHGSQSSAPNDQENGPTFYSQYPTAVINGGNGQNDEVRLHHNPRQKSRAGSQALAPFNINNSNATATANANFSTHPVGPPPMVDHLDGLVGYIQAQFADSELADYTLELRYSDDRAEPVRVPGHNIIFARSPTLKALMKAQARVNNGDSLTGKSLLIESNDRFLRSDGFWMAVQRLYGGPLLDFGSAAMNHLQRSTPQPYPMPGTAADRCDLGLGYAAAGHILQIPPVVNRGAEIAGHFVNWDTIEKALDFALDGGAEFQWGSNGQLDQTKYPSTYGPSVDAIIHGTLNFLISAFPPTFELDTSVGEPAYNSRLPRFPEERPAQNSRLSFIKFGDHPSEESAKSQSESDNPIFATLSKVLLSLPFHLLRYVLESPRLGNVEGWATTNLRQRAMYSVIEERERRRIKVVSGMQAQRIKNKHGDTVHWQEAVSLHSGQEGTPVLTRTWIDY